MNTPDKRIIIIAGPNGAGKTTFAGEFLPNEAHCPTFVNADLIAAGLAPFEPERAAFRAGRRRFVAGLRNFENLYKPVVNEWALYDNSGGEPALIEEGVNA
ncbi:MAG: hypothetical protein U5S82_17865 [Gammaproteobacteria bacterium]|nr:hypothetical protein [Gammaproteobacteria bacterium]